MSASGLYLCGSDLPLLTDLAPLVTPGDSEPGPAALGSDPSPGIFLLLRFVPLQGTLEGGS